LEFLKRRSNDPLIVDDFINHLPGLLKELKLENIYDEVCESFPYLIDFFKANITIEDNTTTIYRELLYDYGNQFPNLLKLITIYKILPLTTVECERTFSEQSRTKTKLRSSMEEELLESLLLLSMNCKSNENDEIKELTNGTIFRWKSKRERYFFDSRAIQ